VYGPEQITTPPVLDGLILLKISLFQSLYQEARFTWAEFIVSWQWSLRSTTFTVSCRRRIHGEHGFYWLLFFFFFFQWAATAIIVTMSIADFR
jgi:hypothetical protein